MGTDTNQIFGEIDRRKAVKRHECGGAVPAPPSRLTASSATVASPTYRGKSPTVSNLRRVLKSRVGNSTTVAATRRSIQLPWFSEFAERVHRCCLGIERASARHVPVRKAARIQAWWFRHRAYRTAPQIKPRMGAHRLVAHYYHWLKSGKSPACFPLHFVDRLPLITPDQMRRFVGACTRPGTRSWRQATKMAGFDRGKVWRIRRRLPVSLIQRIKQVFKLRRQTKLDLRAAAALFRVQAGRRKLEARAAAAAFQAQARGRLQIDRRHGRAVRRMLEHRL